MKRRFWLQNCGIALEIQQSTEDLRFDGQFLLSDKMDETLLLFKDSWAVLCLLGFHTPAAAASISVQVQHQQYFWQTPYQARQRDYSKKQNK